MTRESFYAKVRKTDTCWLWEGSKIRNNGYGRSSLGGRQTTAHRVAWQLENGPVPSGMEIAHKCDVRACVRPDHLFLATHAENQADMARKGRAASGDRNPSRMLPERLIGKVGARQPGTLNGMSKLTDDAVREIRASSEPPRVIGPRYGITAKHVWRVRSGGRWSHVAEHHGDPLGGSR